MKDWKMQRALMQFFRPENLFTAKVESPDGWLPQQREADAGRVGCVPRRGETRERGLVCMYYTGIDPFSNSPSRLPRQCVTKKCNER
jgi:hypothetical protein